MNTPEQRKKVTAPFRIKINKTLLRNLVNDSGLGEPSICHAGDGRKSAVEAVTGQTKSY